MEKTKRFLAEMKEMVFNKLHNGLSSGELPNIVDIIHDIEAIEKYIADCDYVDIDSDEFASLDKNIRSELAAAEKYAKEWSETRDAIYKTLARDELRHAETFIKLATPKALTQDKKDQLQSLTLKYQQLIKVLS